jgi:hypothetical protein
MSDHATLSEARRLERRWQREEKPQALLVRADLGAPIAHGPIPWGRHNLDGLLAWALLDLLDRHPRVYAGPVLRLPLPLLAVPVGDGSGHVWACSELRPTTMSSDSYTRWRKRPDEHEALVWLRGRRLPRSVGPHRAYDQPLAVTTTRQIGSVCVGYPAAISRLLDRIHSLGKKRSQGYGRVLRWSVVELDHEPEPMLAIADDDGAATRAIPVELAERLGITGRLAVAAWRPPYWLRDDWRMVITP